MNTCQTSIKTDMFFSTLVVPFVVPNILKITTFGCHRTDLSGEGQTDKTKDLPNTYSRSTAETTINPIAQNIPVICLHFETTTNNPASFIIRDI